jgi:ATP-dependent DNA helicase RecG
VQPVIDKLDKMISLEIEQGYKNKAVIGGLKGVLPWWPQQAREVCDRPEQHALIDGVIERIEGYEALADPGAREAAIAEIRRCLQEIDAGGSDGAADATGPQDAVAADRPAATARPAVEAPPATPAVPEPPDRPAVVPPPAQPAAAHAAEAESQSPSQQTAAASPCVRYTTTENDPQGTRRSGLDSPVTTISGVGPTQAKRLERLGVQVIGDLLYLYPRRHEDYSKLRPIAELEYGEQVTVVGTIRATKLKRTRGAWFPFIR